MWLKRVWGYLLPGGAERDEGFRLHIGGLSRQGLYIIAGVELVSPLFLLAAQHLVMSREGTVWHRTWQTASVMAVGALTLLAARAESIRFSRRLVGCLSGWLVGAALTSCSLLMFGQGAASDHYIPAQITSVLLVGVGAMPLRPMHTLSLGLAMWGYFLIAGPLAVHWNLAPVVEQQGTHSVFILMITFLSAALSAVLYAERVASYRSQQQALRASDSLVKAQSRALLSENAASLGRLAAALSHDLNNPIGALTSAVDTMVLLAARQATSPPAEHERLVRLQAELRRSVADSTRRLREIVSRMQRFTNLDKADVQTADLNELVSDAIALMEPQIKDSVRVEVDLRSVPALTCRPQQLSAVFTSLLHNAIEAIQNGNGRIQISTHEVDSHVEVRIRDNGRGLRSDELATIFDPGFKVAGGRVSTGNWSLFSSRQIVREHGGDIRIESREGQGTTVSIKLPRLTGYDFL